MKEIEQEIAEFKLKILKVNELVPKLETMISELDEYKKTLKQIEVLKGEILLLKEEVIISVNNFSDQNKFISQNVNSLIENGNEIKSKLLEIEKIIGNFSERNDFQNIELINYNKDNLKFKKFQIILLIVIVIISIINLFIWKILL